MMVTPRRCQNASKSPAGCYHASEALDRERFEAGALSASGTREPRRRSEVDKVYRAKRSANLKTCKQVRAKYFYEACPSATRRTRPASKRQRGIRVSARTRDSGVLWGMS